MGKYNRPIQTLHEPTFEPIEEEEEGLSVSLEYTGMDNLIFTEGIEDIEACEVSSTTLDATSDVDINENTQLRRKKVY